jgi:hypothetical protein
VLPIVVRAVEIRERQRERESYAKRSCVDLKRGIMGRAPWCKDYTVPLTSVGLAVSAYFKCFAGDEAVASLPEWPAFVMCSAIYCQREMQSKPL